MKKLTIYSLVLVGLFCGLSPVYAAQQNKAITPMLGLLLGNSGGTVITKSITGQPGEVATVLLGDDHPTGTIEYVRMGDKEVIPVSWDGVTNEVKAMIPPIAVGQYRLSVFFSNGLTPSIPLTVLPFGLPAGGTADSVLASVDKNMRTMFQEVTGFMANAGYAQTNLNTFNGILDVFMSRYSKMTAEEKEFIATFLNNMDLVGLLQEMRASGAQTTSMTIQRSPTPPACMTVTPKTDSYSCKNYERWDELAKYRSYYKFLQLAENALNNFVIYVADKLMADNCIASGATAVAFKGLTAQLSIITTLLDAAKTVVGVMPVVVTDLSVKVKNTTLSYYDETGFAATATMEPASTVLSGMVHLAINALTSKLKDKVKDSGVCYNTLISQAIDIVSGALDQYTSDNSLQVEASDSEPVAVPPKKLVIETEEYVTTLTTFCPSPYTHYGKSLYVNFSVAADGRKQAAEEVVFKYPYTLSHEYSLTDSPAVDLHVLTVKNRAPELEDMTVSIDAENEINEEITIDLDSKDQECDKITKWEVVGTAQYGTLDTSYLAANELHYTLTTADPGGNEVFTLRFFDGAEWGETTLTIDLSVVNCTYSEGMFAEEPSYSATCSDDTKTFTASEDIYYINIWYDDGVKKFASRAPVPPSIPNVVTRTYEANVYDDSQYRYTCGSERELAGCSGSACDISQSRTSVVLQRVDNLDNKSVMNSWCMPCATSDTPVETINADFSDRMQTCSEEVIGLIPSEISAYIRRGSCHDWWDHYDEEGKWVECSY